MDAFREAWTVFEQPSTSTVSADGHCRFFQQTPNAQVQDAEWRQFVSSIEQDEPANPAAGFDFMSSVPQTSVPTDMMNNYEIPQTEEAPVSAPHDPAASSSLPPAPYGNVFLSEDDLASGVWTYLGSDEPFAYNNLDGQGQDCEFGNDAQLGADYEVPPAQNYDQSHHSETAARHNGYDVHVPQTIATSLEGMGDAVRDDEADDDPPDPCYAKLLYRCLREAPNHMMTLKEVYEWMTFNTVKARDSSSRGWQNSVRHNLSMNAVSGYGAPISLCRHMSRLTTFSGVRESDSPGQSDRQEGESVAADRRRLAERSHLHNPVPQRNKEEAHPPRRAGPRTPALRRQRRPGHPSCHSSCASDPASHINPVVGLRPASPDALRAARPLTHDAIHVRRIGHARVSGIDLGFSAHELAAAYCAPGPFTVLPPAHGRVTLHAVAAAASPAAVGTTAQTAILLRRAASRGSVSVRHRVSCGGARRRDTLDPWRVSGAAQHADADAGHGRWDFFCWGHGRGGRHVRGGAVKDVQAGPRDGKKRLQLLDWGDCAAMKWPEVASFASPGLRCLFQLPRSRSGAQELFCGFNGRYPIVSSQAFFFFCSVQEYCLSPDCPAADLESDG